MSTTIDLLDNRVELLEHVVNSIQTALTNVTSSEAIDAIILLVQRDIQGVQTDLTQLRREFELVKAEVFK